MKDFDYIIIGGGCAGLSLAYELEISDKLKDVINYEELYVDVENCVKENKFNLIEALAEKILNVIMLKYTVVESSVVRVRKPFAPIKGIFDNIEFEIVKKRNDYE